MVRLSRVNWVMDELRWEFGEPRANETLQKFVEDNFAAFFDEATLTIISEDEGLRVCLGQHEGEVDCASMSITELLQEFADFELWPEARTTEEQVQVRAQLKELGELCLKLATASLPNAVNEDATNREE